MRKSRQKGTLTRACRPSGRDIWVFRWIELSADGARRPRKLVIGTTKELRSEAAAWQCVEELDLNINLDLAVKAPRPRSFAELVEHFTVKELPDHEDADDDGRAFSTKYNYKGYLRKWILPKWGRFELNDIKAVAVEEWLRGLWLEPSAQYPQGKKLANASKKKIRDLMHLIYQHAIRYEWMDRNPISLVRQGARREKTPDILTLEELALLLNGLNLRERVAVFLDFGTGMRRGELQGCKWQDFNFRLAELRLERSNVNQRNGRVKTEASAKPIPLSPSLISDLELWRRETPYAQDSDYVFASPAKEGKQPYWLARLMSHEIKAVARHLGITKNIGWHTLRRTYATLIQRHNDDPKVAQELLRHASFSITMNLYAQAVTEKKRNAQSKVVEMVASARRIDRFGHRSNQLTGAVV